MQSAPAQPVHVLLVDDHRDTREMYALSLEFSGMHVRTSSRCSDALAMIALEPPDVVITDLHLGAESGLDLAYRISSSTATPSIPVVLLTGDTRQDLAARAKAAGCAAVAIKPVMPDALVELIMTTVAAHKTPLPPWMLHFRNDAFVVSGHPLLCHRGFLPAAEKSMQ